MSIIEVRHLTYVYSQDTPGEKKALDDISFTVNEAEFLGILGANGSGKSTLIQHLNGLLLPSQGTVTVCGKDTVAGQTDDLWMDVGLVFQFPEQQLFEATVFEDVAYGPKNLGLDREEIAVRVNRALQTVGLDPEAVGMLPPLCLSGGMRRLVAIAGVLAIEPRVLVLDEPTAGLDPRSRRSVMSMIKQAQRDRQATVVMVSHSLRELLVHADRLLVLNQGKLVAVGPTRDILESRGFQGLPGIELPEYLQVLHDLAGQGRRIGTAAGSIAEAVANIERMMMDEKAESEK